MNLNQINENLAKLGLVSDVRATGHTDFVRCFVHCPQPSGIPLSLGRITIQNGVYSHCKWYVSQFNHNGLNEEYDYYWFAWGHLLSTGNVITREFWAQLVAKAREMARAEFERKKQWREDNPKPNGGNRARLRTMENPQRFLYRALAELEGKHDVN
jgi:hypothetical protein